MSQNGFDLKDFRRACGRFPTGVTVTTVMGTGGQPCGITASSFTSVSLTPPLVLVCIDHRSPITQHLEIGQHFGINVLSDRQEEISARFSRKWEERFADMKWRPGATGVPLLADVPAALECVITQMVSAGDHWIVIGKALHIMINEGAPLAYFDSAYGKVVRHPPPLLEQAHTALAR